MEIRIGKSAHACAGCGRAFTHEETVKSLVRVENRDFVREDYCAACWQADRGARAFSTWSTRFYDPKVAEQAPPEEFSPLRQLFYEAVEATERAEMAKAYLAAQLLRRQKVFRFIKESEDAEIEGRVALFSDRIGNRFIEVRDPDLTLAEMEAGRQTLIERLNELEGVSVAEENPNGVEHAEEEQQD